MNKQKKYEKLLTCFLSSLYIWAIFSITSSSVICSNGCSLANVSISQRVTANDQTSDFDVNLPYFFIIKKKKTHISFFMFRYISKKKQKSLNIKRFSKHFNSGYMLVGMNRVWIKYGQQSIYKHKIFFIHLMFSFEINI